MPEHGEEILIFFFPGNRPAPARDWLCQALLRELRNTWVHFLGVNTAGMVQRLWKCQGIVFLSLSGPSHHPECPLCVWQVLEELFPSLLPACSFLLPGPACFVFPVIAAEAQT